MSQLAYVAAEYFIEALGRSSTFCITYDDVHSLINQAGKDIASYLKNESKKDFLFIFRRFPDVFIFNGFTVSLTDAFLSLYAFPSSANFSTTYKSANASETAAIEYFKLILSRTGTFHYMVLFNMLLSQNGLQLSQYFSHYSTTDMYSFFQTHSKTFTMLTNNVYLKINPPLEAETIDFEQESSSKCLTKLTKCTCFLLTCFESLHYIELKQCISFVLSAEKEFLNQHSLIKQREIFENLSETTMDEWGYLYLNDFSACMPRSRKVRLVVLIVCILGFEREMHFQKLVQEVNKRTSSDVSALICNLPISDQFKFFKSFADFFVMGGNGYVSLLSSFVFPVCSFENSIPNLQTFQNKQSYVSNSEADNQNKLKHLLTSNNVLEKSKNSNGNIITELQTDQKSLQATTDVQVNSQNSNCNNIQSTQPRNWIKSLQSASNVGAKSQDPNYNIDNIALTAELHRLDAKFGNLNLLDKHQISFSDNSGTVNARMKLSIVYLLSRFTSPLCQNILKSCLHILDDVRIYFLNLSPSDKQNFIGECYCFFNAKLNEELIPDSVPYADNKEKTLLYIVYLLLIEGQVHIKKLSKTLISSKVCTLLLFMNTSKQLEYFREMGGYFIVSPDGFISLYKFDVINCVIDSHFDDLISEVSSSTSIVSTNKELNNVPSKIIMLDNSSKSADASIIYNEHKNISNGVDTSSEIKATDTDIPLLMYKRLWHFLFYIQNYFISLLANRVLETFLHSLTDVKSHFSNLSTKDQHRFVKEYFQCINNESVVEISPSEPHPSATSLTEEERIVLLVTYMLIEKKSLHYEYIVRKLNEFKVKCSLCSKKPASQFKHFKTLNEYFLINSDGFVCLNSSFYSLSSIINSVSAFSPEIQKKLKSNIKIKKQPKSDMEKDEISNVSSKSSVQNIVVNLNVHDEETKRSILITNETVKSNNVNGHSGKTNMDNLTENEIVKESLSENSSDEVIDGIVDVCFSILSVCKKMQVEKLCCRLNSCGIKHIQNYFSFFTFSEKVHFFTNIPQYFDITRDGFVCLKEDAFSSYVPKYNPIPVNEVTQGLSVSEKASCAKFSGRSQSVNSCDISDLSETQSGMSDCSTNKSCSDKKTRTRRRPKRSPRKFTIAPEALTNIKSFLNSGNSATKFQNSWKTRCDNSSENTQSISVTISHNRSVKSANAASVSSQNTSIVVSQNSSVKTAHAASSSSLAVSQKNSVKTINSTSASSQNISPASVPQNSSVKTVNSVSTSSQNTSVVISRNGSAKTLNAAYISSQSFTKQKFNFDSSSKKILKTNSPNTSVFQFGTPSQMASESSIQFPIPRQPLESQFPSKQDVSSQALNTVNPCMIMKGVNSDFESCSMSASALKCNNLQQSKEIIKKYASKEQTSGNLQSANVSKLFSMDTLSSPVNCDNDNVHSKEIQNDSYESYGTELLNSFLGELSPDLFTTYSSSVNHVCQNDQTKNREHNSSHSEQESVCNNIENSFSNLKTISKTYDVPFLEPPRYNSQLKHSDLNSSKSSSLHESDDVTELRAVNFFCAILGNYEIGVSADFLISHLNLALSEVQTFMFNHYENDNLSFFSKHKKVFYVSPQTNNVYLLRKD